MHARASAADRRPVVAPSGDSLVAGAICAKGGKVMD